MNRLILAILCAMIIAIPAARADPINDLMWSFLGQEPVAEGFSRTVCQGTTGGNCAEGALLWSVNCAGSGSGYHCNVTYRFRLTLLGLGLDPQNLTQPPLYVTAWGDSDVTDPVTVEGVAWSRSYSGLLYTVRHDNVPPEGKNLRHTISVCIAIGPHDSRHYPVCDEGETTGVIHLPSENASGGPGLSIGDPTGLIGSVTGVGTELLLYGFAQLEQISPPATVAPGPMPEPPTLPPMKPNPAQASATLPFLATDNW